LLKEFLDVDKAGVLPKGRVHKGNLAFARIPESFGVLPKGRVHKGNLAFARIPESFGVLPKGRVHKGNPDKSGASRDFR